MAPVNMRFLVRILSVYLLAGVAFAQIPPQQKTHELLNCRYWNSINRDERIGFIFGYVEAWFFVDGQTKLDTGDYAAHGSSVGEFIEGVTRVCREPENGRLTMIQASALFSAKFRGETDDFVNSLAQRFRKIWTDADKSK
jgi:hypothetical protein